MFEVEAIGSDGDKGNGMLGEDRWRAELDRTTPNSSVAPGEARFDRSVGPGMLTGANMVVDDSGVAANGSTSG